MQHIRFWPRGLTFAAALSVWSASVAWAETEPAGRVDRVQNIVTAESGGARRTLEPDGFVYSGDVLMSQEAARLEATLTDETKITLGENAVLRIDDFVFTPGTSGGSLSIKVLNGAFLFVGGQVEGPTGGNVAISTGFATLGIRGTTVWGGPLDGAFAVLVLDGEVTVTNGGTTVTLTPNTGTTITDAASPPQPPAIWAQDKVDRALATISFQQ